MAKTPDNYAIHLASRTGTQLDNLQANKLSRFELSVEADLRAQFRDVHAATFLTGSCPVYNCHGMTFASRRTKPEPEAFTTLLEEDGYRKVGPDEFVQVGGIAIYLDDDDRVAHSGLVVGLVQAYGFDRIVPWVLSKWGSGPEVLHRYDYCPYPSRVDYYRQKAWQNV